jgi:hypothetical protein
MTNVLNTLRALLSSETIDLFIKIMYFIFFVPKQKVHNGRGEIRQKNINKL